MRSRSRTLDAGGVTLALILGLLAGPAIFYAAAGDYWHSLGLTVPTPLAIVAALALTVAALANATRFRNAGLAGALTGVAAGVGELAVAVIPWIGVTQIKCAEPIICPPIARGDLISYAAYVGGFAIVICTIGGFSLALLVRTLRSRMA